MTEPLNYRGVVTDTISGTIISITEPSSMGDLQSIRNKIIEGSHGTRNLVIVEKLVGAALCPGLPTSADGGPVGGSTIRLLPSPNSRPLLPFVEVLQATKQLG
jgi:hypothetical protein